jgi:hypothetical protein
MRLLKRETIPRLHLPTLGIREGDVSEIEEIKNFGKFLEKDPSIFQWWRIAMGYVKDDNGA